MCTASVLFAVFTSILTVICINNTDAYAREGENQDLVEADAVQTAAEDDGSFMIPIPLALDESQVEVDFSCEKKKINVIVNGVSSSFYYENPLQGDVGHVTGFLYGQDDAAVILEIELDDFVVCNYDIEEGFLAINIKPLSEVYQHIVVVDAAHYTSAEDTGSKMYGIKECEVNYLAAQKLKEALLSKGFGVLMTRPEEKMPEPTEFRDSLCQAANPDMIISLTCAADENTRVTHGMRVTYAEGAEKIADSIYEEIEAEDTPEIMVSELETAKVPLVQVKLGYLTNKSDAMKLSDEGYLSLLAEKMAEGVVKYYGE